jgi:hypothetical protein
MQMYCTFVPFVNQHFPGLPTSGTHCMSDVLGYDIIFINNSESHIKCVTLTRLFKVC